MFLTLTGIPLIETCSNPNFLARKMPLPALSKEIKLALLSNCI